MNPLRSTSAKSSAQVDSVAFRAALAQPYKVDLKHFLDQARESEVAKEGSMAAPLRVSSAGKLWRRVCAGVGALAVSLGVAPLKKSQIST